MTIVTLLTDFGTEDYFTGAMKGAILSRDPRIRIVDITHHVPPHDIDAAALRRAANTPAVITMVSDGTTGKNPSRVAIANNAR